MRDCFKKYSVYKRYCDMMAKEILQKDVSSMNKKELIEFLNEVRTLSRYSQKCYSLREEYRDTCVDEKDRDEGHEIAIRKAKEYHFLTKTVMDKIASRFYQLESSNKGKESMEALASKINGLVLKEPTEESISEASIASSNASSTETLKSKRRRKKKGTSTSVEGSSEESLEEISKVAAEVKNEIESRRDALYNEIIDSVYAALVKYNIKFTDEEFYLLIQRLSLVMTGSSLQNVYEAGLKTFKQKIDKITKEMLVTQFVQTKKEMKGTLVKVNHDGSIEKQEQLNVLEKTVPVKVNFKNKEFILYLFKQQTIADFKNSLIKTFDLDSDKVFTEALRTGGDFVILNSKGRKLKENAKIVDAIKPYEKLKPVMFVD